MAAPIFGLANQVFQIQNSGVRVPTRVLSAARNVLAYSATNADKQAIYDYLKIRKTGAGAVKSQLGQAGSLMAKAGMYATLAQTAGQGGVAGIGAAFGLVGNAAKDIEQLAKAKWFQKVVEGATTKLLGKQILYQVRGGARVAGVLMQGAAIGAGIGYGLSSTSDALDGMGGGEALREARSRNAVAQANPSKVSWMHRKVLERNLKSEQIRADNAGSWVPIFGDVVNSVRMKRRGLDPETTGRLETLDNARDARFGGNSDKVRALARERLFRDKYGATLGKYFENRYDQQIKKTIGANPQTEAEITGKSAQMISEASEHRAAYYKEIASGNFKAAAAERGAANESVPGFISGPSASDRYQAAEGARVSGRQWVYSQSARAGARSWDVP